MLSVVADEAAQAELRGDLDELAREGARRMLAAALEAEVDDYLAAHAPPSGTSAAGGWWCATATPASARSPPLAGAIPVRAPRVTTAASTRRPASGPGSGR